MNCMKCGREVPDQQVFCESCMEVMNNYPVKMDAAVQLPVRKDAQPNKKAVRRRPALSEQEQIRRLKTRVRRLWTALAIVLVLFAILACFTTNHLLKDRRPLPGQNYTTSKSETIPE